MSWNLQASLYLKASNPHIAFWIQSTPKFKDVQQQIKRLLYLMLLGKLTSRVLTVCGMAHRKRTCIRLRKELQRHDCPIRFQFSDESAVNQFISNRQIVAKSISLAKFKIITDRTPLQREVFRGPKINPYVNNYESHLPQTPDPLKVWKYFCCLHCPQITISYWSPRRGSVMTPRTMQLPSLNINHSRPGSLPLALSTLRGGDIFQYCWQTYSASVQCDTFPSQRKTSIIIPIWESHAAWPSQV